jgi:hypothetical protein
MTRPLETSKICQCLFSSGDLIGNMQTLKNVKHLLEEAFILLPNFPLCFGQKQIPISELQSVNWTPFQSPSVIGL